MSTTWKKNLLFTAVVAAILLIWWRLTPSGGDTGTVAVLQYGEPQETLRIPLDTDKTYDLPSGGYTIHLRVEGGAIAFVGSPCPDHTCERFGRLASPGDWAACLPAKASVTIE